jgi:hypothetical protein
MDRKTARNVVKTILDGLGVFHVVYAAPVRAFNGESPVAVVLGQTLQDEQIARGVWRQPIGLTLTVYTRNDEGDAAAEDLHDSLVQQVLEPLRNAGFIVGGSDAAPDGAPLSDIDKVLYRTERIPLRRSH